MGYMQRLLIISLLLGDLNQTVVFVIWSAFFFSFSLSLSLSLSLFLSHFPLFSFRSGVMLGGKLPCLMSPVWFLVYWVMRNGQKNKKKFMTLLLFLVLLFVHFINLSCK